VQDQLILKEFNESFVQKSAQPANFKKPETAQMNKMGKERAIERKQRRY